MAREFISPEGLRLDGRRAKELRKIDCQLALFSRVDGSAYYEQGNTKVMASIYGPHEVTQRRDAMHDRAHINCEYSMAAFSTSERKKYSKQDRRFTEIAMMIRQTFETVILTHLFPRCQISIFITVLQDHGGARAAAINATTLALINAGIPMSSFLCACSAGLIDNTPVLDLNYVEKAGNNAELVVAVDPKTENISYSQMDNKLPLDQLSTVLALAIKGSQQIHQILKDKVKQYSLSLVTSE